MNYLVNYRKCINNSSHKLLLICTVLLISIVFVPDFSFFVTEILILANLFWGTTILSKYNKIGNVSKQMIISAFLYFFVVVFYKVSGISQATWDIAAGYYGWVFAIIIAVYCFTYFNDHELKILEFCMFLVSCLSMIFVIRTGLHNLQIMDVEDAISQENAAYSSLVMLFSGLCFFALINYHSKWLKLLYFLALVTSIVVNLVILQRGTNVIFTFFLFVFITFFKYVKIRKMKMSLIIVSILALSLYSTGFYIDLLEELVEIIPSERVATRLQSIVIFLKTDDVVAAGSSFTTRTELAEQSLATFSSSISNIFLGIGDSRGFSQKIGDHSEIIDSLARYGIFGFVILVFSFICQFKYLKNLISGNLSLTCQILVIYFGYILRNINGNTMTSPVSLLLFLYLPVVVYFINKQKTI